MPLFWNETKLNAHFEEEASKAKIEEALHSTTNC
jgi:hypothetical protein